MEELLPVPGVAEDQLQGGEVVPHLDLIIKQQTPTANTINLNNPETQQISLDTRLVQPGCCHPHVALTGGLEDCRGHSWPNVPLQEGVPAKDNAKYYEKLVPRCCCIQALPADQGDVEEHLHRGAGQYGQQGVGCLPLLFLYQVVIQSLRGLSRLAAPRLRRWPGWQYCWRCPSHPPGSLS